MLDIMKRRRSIRKFTDDKLTGEEKNKILAAALLAPSSKSIYPVEFVATEDRALIQRLEKCKKPGGLALATATFAIAVIADRDKSDVWIEDSAIAATMVLLEVEALGLGATWIQMRQRQGESLGSEEEVRHVLGIPENYGVLAVMAIGRKGEEKAPYGDGDIKTEKVHWDKFSR